MKETGDIRAHYGFTTTPFTREFSVSNRYHHPLFEQEIVSLRQTIEDRMSAALIAPAGTGKTVLLRALRESLPEARYRTRYIKVTSLSKRDMCREIARTIGCETAGQYNTLVHHIQSHLATWGDHLIDEAHEMRIDVLSMIRLLTNFDMDSRLVVSVILCGQNNLARLLARDEMEALSRRLAHVGTLRPLSRDETKQYVAHRLTQAGCKSNPFTEAAQDALFEIGRGNLRATDCLALKALQLAARTDISAIDPNYIAKARERIMP